MFSYKLGKYEISVNNSLEQFFNTIILFKRFLKNRICIFRNNYNINKKIKNLKNEINTLKFNLLKINNNIENYWLKKVETMENEILFWKKFLLYDNYLIQKILQKTNFLEISSNRLNTTSLKFFKNHTLNKETIKILCDIVIPKYEGEFIIWRNEDYDKLEDIYENCEKYEYLKNYVIIGGCYEIDYYLCINIKTEEIMLFPEKTKNIKKIWT